MTRDSAKPPKPWSWRESALLGVLLSIPVGIITVGVSVGTGNWIWALLTVPVMVILSVSIGWIARVGSRRKGFVAAATGTGLLFGAAVGFGLIWFGISFNLNASTCDPEIGRCVTVIDGVASGESTESVGSQQFGNFLLSLVAILPGAVILVVVTRGVVSLVRKVRGRPGAPGPDPV